MKHLKNGICLSLCTLMLVMLLVFVGCNNTTTPPTDTTAATTTVTDPETTASPETTVPETTVPETTTEETTAEEITTVPETTVEETEPETTSTLDVISSLVEFVVEVETGREIRVLQLTDPQIIDAGQCRYPERMSGYTEPLSDEQLEREVFYYMREAIERSDPDLIMITGDIIYGEFDDAGTSLLRLIDFMESFGIPWAPVFGNHDNESMKGVTWQCEQYEAAEHCLFARGPVVNCKGNYSIGLVQGDKLVRTVYMMNSNGCAGAFNDLYRPDLIEPYNEGERVHTDIGLTRPQLNWLKKKAAAVDSTLGYTVPKFIAFHIPINEFARGAYSSGYQSNSDSGNREYYTIGTTVPAQNGDFGCKGEHFKGIHGVDGLWEILKTNNFDGLFCGHSHLNNVSIFYDGIRLTFGLKSSTHDRYAADQLGGTLATVNGETGTFTVGHVYVTPPRQE